RRLANAAPEPATRHDNALDLRRLGKTHHRIVVEVSGAVSRSRDHGAAELHRAGPALGNAAAIARAGQPDRVAQYPEQGRLGLDIDIVGFSVNGQSNHARPLKL